MALYFPELFCNIGQQLILIKDISFEDLTIRSGEKCIVSDIVEYGFDIVTENENIEFRMMNSEMPEYFKKTDNIAISAYETRNSMASEPAAVYGVMKDRQEDFILNHNMLTFIFDFEIKDAVKIEKGKKFFFVKDGRYVNLHDINSYRKVLRMSEKEMAHYCQLES